MWIGYISNRKWVKYSSKVKLIVKSMNVLCSLIYIVLRCPMEKEIYLLGKTMWVEMESYTRWLLVLISLPFQTISPRSGFSDGGIQLLSLLWGTFDSFWEPKRIPLYHPLSFSSVLKDISFSSHFPHHALHRISSFYNIVYALTCYIALII